MLKITLYKNCILNNEYREVFSLGKETGQELNVLERYLGTLSSKVYEIDNVYQENEGTLIFDFEIENNVIIYDFNYMKVETIDENSQKILRYCFIDDIKIKNELVYLEYSEDIWSSYSNKISGITESYLSGSKILNYHNSFLISPYNLPIEYESNNKLNITQLYPLNSKYDIIFEYQLYIADEHGVYTERHLYFGILRDYNINNYSGYNFSQILDIISGLIMHQADGKVDFNPTSLPTEFSYNYEIGNIYVIPFNFGIHDKLQSGSVSYIKAGITRDDFLRVGTFTNIATTEKTQLLTGTISNNFRNRKFGTFNTNTDLINNGTDINYEVFYTCCNYGFSLTLSVQNNFLDITSDFQIITPIKSLKGEELSLYKLEKDISQRKLTYNFKKDQANAFLSGIAGVGDFESALGGENQFKVAGGILKSITKMGGAIVKENYSMATTKADEELLHAKFYSSNKSNFTTSSTSTLYNIGYSLCIFEINPDNENFVNKAIDNYGYDTFIFINDINNLELENPDIFLQNNEKFNTLRFYYINIYGKFTRNIAIKLNDIFKNGFKIWFNYLRN